MKKIQQLILRNRQLVVSGSILIVVLIGLFVGLFPAIKKIHEQSGALASLSVEVKKLDEKSRLLSSYSTEELQTDYAVVISAIPKDLSIATFIGTIDSLADQYGVILGSFTIEGIGSVATGSAKKEGKNQQFGAYTVMSNFTVEGELSNIRSFLDTMVRVRRLLRIKTFDLSFGPGQSTLKARLSIEGYYLPVPGTLGKLGDILEPLTSKEQEILSAVREYPLLSKANESEESSSTTPLSSDPFSP